MAVSDLNWRDAHVAARLAPPASLRLGRGARVHKLSRVIACESEGASGRESHYTVDAGDGDSIPRHPENLAAEWVEKLEQTVAAVLALAQLDWGSVSGEVASQAVRAVERAARASAAIRSGALVAISKSEQWRKDGNRNVAEWVATQTGRSKAVSSRATKVATQMEKHLPETFQALANGEISEDHANAIVTHCTKSQKQLDRLKDPHRGERHLLEQAKKQNATKFAKSANGWATESDPRTADKEWRQTEAAQVVHLTPVEEGFLLEGRLNAIDGQILQTALAAHMGRKAGDDDRSFPQRRAEALIGLARQSLDSGKQMSGARIRPHLTITMGYETLDRLVQAAGPSMPPATAAAHGLAHLSEGARKSAQAKWAADWKPGADHVISTELDYAVLENVPPATLPDGSALAPSALARLACQSKLMRVIFGPESTVLDAGREQRIFPANQARAIIARDQTCQYPGCDEGPEFSEIHHSLEWYKHGGTTHADLGILLCYTHHGHVHRAGITIMRSRGSWIFVDPGGHEISPPSVNPGERREEQRVKPGGSVPDAAYAPRDNGISPHHYGQGASIPAGESGPGALSIPASEGLCPDLWEQEPLNLDPEPPF